MKMNGYSLPVQVPSVKKNCVHKKQVSDPTSQLRSGFFAQARIFFRCIRTTDFTKFKTRLAVKPSNVIAPNAQKSPDSLLVRQFFPTAPVTSFVQPGLNQ
jgi:hypothetical protein